MERRQSPATPHRDRTRHRADDLAGTGAGHRRLGGDDEQRGEHLLGPARAVLAAATEGAGATRTLFAGNGSPHGRLRAHHLTGMPFSTMTQADSDISD
ncbi:MAG TPA: hypothetical protein VK083_07390 [Nocardia sp.]|uniref:hypothetical protein n=1 Tax=Nocardia TaxID=1817 RepID=UPI002453E110|nr:MULTISPECIES: hypothetical protein [Nocardia]HLS76593.1 hypothetical protein [Nocardia sp.]